MEIKLITVERQEDVLKMKLFIYECMYIYVCTYLHTTKRKLQDISLE